MKFVVMGVTLFFSATVTVAEPKYRMQECLMGNEPSSSWFGKYAMARFAVKPYRDQSKWYYMMHSMQRHNDFGAGMLEGADWVESNFVQVNQRFCKFGTYKN